VRTAQISASRPPTTPGITDCRKLPSGGLGSQPALAKAIHRTPERAAMIVEYLVKNKKGPILAVDADPNSNLNEVLGVDIRTTLGDIREKMQYKDAVEEELPANMTKQEFTEFMFNDALVEEDDYDMIVMGRTQGAGCYCYVNGILKTQLEKYKGGYRYIVVDNEAGLEHISRGILPHIDVLLMISDASRWLVWFE
jgi:CO dehydrogenase maturation factor